VVNAAAGVFAAVFAALWVGHDVGDHWLQAHTDAVCKTELEATPAGFG
jgi:hypothetical protein